MPKISYKITDDKTEFFRENGEKCFELPVAEIPQDAIDRMSKQIAEEVAENAVNTILYGELERCPICKDMSVTVKHSGVECINKGCSYWFCY